jgi:hypothetical protein
VGELSYARDLYYRSSARTPAWRVMLALVLTAAGGALVGVLYAIASRYVILLHDMFLVTGAAVAVLVGFAFLSAGLTAGLLRWMKVVTAAPKYWLSLCAAGATWYASWVAWERLVLHRIGVDLPLIKQLIPSNVWYLAQFINEVGTISVGSPRRPINGAELWAIWAIETVVLWLIPAWFPPRWVRGTALCHFCGRWCHYRQGFLSVGYADPAQVRTALENKDLPAVEALGPADMNGPRRIRLDLQSCTGCDQSHLLSGFIVESKIAATGGHSDKPRRFIDRLWLDAEQAKELHAIKQRLWPPIAEVAPADAADDAKPQAAEEAGDSAESRETT